MSLVSCLEKVIRCKSTFSEMLRIHITIYPQTSIVPKYGAFYSNYKVSDHTSSLILQLLLVQPSWREASPLVQCQLGLEGKEQAIQNKKKLSICYEILFFWDTHSFQIKLYCIIIDNPWRAVLFLSYSNSLVIPLNSLKKKTVEIF